MKIHEENKLIALLNYKYEIDEAEAILNAIENSHIDESELIELVKDIEQNWED